MLRLWSWRKAPIRTGLMLSALWPLFAMQIGRALAKSAADYFVESLPGAPPGVPLRRMHAGHIEVVPEHHGNMFFWHYQARHTADRPRTIIWLNGGPGCSSEDGGLMELGPYRVNKDFTLRENDGSWDEFANLLFIDQPVGTGFSYVDTDSYVAGLTESTEQLMLFMEEFFKLFPEYAHDDLYIAGESFAGQYIPYFAQAIVDRNSKVEKPQSRWNLSGLMIGNGWMDAKYQYNADMNFVYAKGFFEKGSEAAAPVERQYAQCKIELEAAGKDAPDIGSCARVLTEILAASTKSPKWKGKCVNVYDIRKHDEYPSCGNAWPPDLEQLVPYLRRKDVLQALHINSDKKTGWVECAGAVGSAFRNRRSSKAALLLPALLAEMPIIMFSGDQDLICNHFGTEDMINDMTWNNGKGMEVSPGITAPRLEWTFEKEPAGHYQTARNLTYLLYYNSSHMVPFDYPRRTRDMADRFMGVDISSIGGVPADSRIDGLKGVETSVGGHTNSTAAVKAEESRVKEAMNRAYYKSGEVALMVVLIAAGVWAWVVWRGRVRRSRGGIAYSTLMSPANNARKLRAPGDVEAADFDEAELDDLTRGHRGDGDEFDVGSDSETEHDHDRRSHEGHVKDSKATQLT